MDASMILGLTLATLIILLSGNKPVEKETRRDTISVVNNTIQANSKTPEEIDEYRQLYLGETINQIAVTEMLLKEKHKQLIWALLLCASFTILFVAVSLLSSSKMPIYYGTPLLLTVLIYIRNKILEYRIKQGFYGSNLYEAKEVIAFLQKNSDDIGGPGGGRKMKVFQKTIPLKKKEKPQWSPERGYGV